MDTLDLTAAAAYLGASTRKTQELAAAGELPGARIGKRWTFRRADLEQYLETTIERQTAARKRQRAEASTPKRPARRFPGRRTPLARL